MLKRIAPLVLITWLLPACGAPAPQAAPPVVRVYATSATYPWLEQVYSCAAPSVVVSLSNPGAAEISLRLGEPTALDSAAYQIGSDDVLAVVQPQAAIGSLSLDELRQIFSGQVTQWKVVGGSDIPIQVWAYAPAEDIQLVFESAVMRGQPITSLARLAPSVQAMSDSVGVTPGSIGFLPRRWKAGNTDAVAKVASEPVLAIPALPPEGPIRDLLNCLQSKE